MKIRNIVLCILSVLILVAGIWMYMLTTSIRILEIPVIIGKLYILGYKIMIPIGILCLIISIVNIIRYRLKENNEKTNDKQSSEKKTNNQIKKTEENDRELEEEFRKIGEITFELYKKGNFDELPQLIEDNCSSCLKKLEKIEVFELEVKETNDRKKCPNCNKDVIYNMKFCSYCGHKFEKQDEKEDTLKVH